MSPFDAKRACGCAARCTRTRRTPTASWRRRCSCATTSGPATTCSRSPTTGCEPRRPRPNEAARHPVDRAERPRARPAERRARARAWGSTADPVIPELDFAPLAGGRRLDRRERRSPLSRPHLLERPAHRAVGGLRGPPRHRGVEHGLRARARTRRFVDALGRGARARTATSSRSRPTTRIIPATTAASPGRGCAPPKKSQEAVLDALRTGLVLRLDRARDIDDVELTDGDVTVRCSPAASVTLYTGPRARRARERGPARLSEQRPDPRARRRRPDHRRPARAAVPTAVRTHRGGSQPTARKPGRTHCGPRRRSRRAARRAPVRPARDRRRDHRRRASPRRRARTGSTVALVDRGDFASATSSASSKLIHGGLRYLQMGDIRLVREAHEERRALMNVVAPHLVHRLPFVFPLYDDGPHRPWFVRTGVLLYSALARAKLNGRVSEARALRLVPQLRTEGLHSSALYADAWTNDGRLTLANVRAAADRGAVVLNYAEVVAIDGDGAEVTRRRRDRRACRRARSSTRRGRGSTACAGSRTRRRAASIRLSQGRAPDRRRRRGLERGDDDPARQGARQLCDSRGRASCCSGRPTRCTKASPRTARVTDDDIRTVLDEAAVGVDGLGEVRASFCGLRVLPGRAGRRPRTRAARPSTRTAAHGMLSVAGGKLTTYRRIALDALDQLGVRNLDRKPRPLPGATGLELGRRGPSSSTRQRAATSCTSTGRSRTEVLAPAVDDPSLLEPIVAGPPRPARAGALRTRARMGAHRRGRAAPPHDRLARGAKVELLNGGSHDTSVRQPASPKREPECREVSTRRSSGPCTMRVRIRFGSASPAALSCDARGRLFRL